MALRQWCVKKIVKRKVNWYRKLNQSFVKSNDFIDSRTRSHGLPFCFILTICCCCNLKVRTRTSFYFFVFDSFSYVLCAFSV